MLLAHRQLKIADQAKKLDDIKVEIPKMGTDEMSIRYYDWDKKIETTLSTKRGVSEIPLDYIIHRDMGPGWDPSKDTDNEQEKHIHQVSLAKNAFDKDTKTVFSLLKQSMIGTPAWSWVRHLGNPQDGRQAMQALQDHYEDQDSINKRVTLAQGVTSMSGNSSVFYNDERVLTFESYYITLLWQSFTTLNICCQPVAQEAMLRRLYDGIRV